MDLLTFVVVSLGLLVIPGPTVIALVSTSLSHGKTRGLQAVAGSSSAMIIQLCIAAIGTAWFVNTVTSGFFFLKWLGVAYLVYLGVKQIMAMWTTQVESLSSTGSFARGFYVALTNPKTILFFSAFLPQFADTSSAYLPQIAILSVIFWCLAVALDTGFVLLASKASPLLRSKSVSKYQNGFSGVLYLGAGCFLASSKNV